MPLDGHDVTRLTDMLHYASLAIRILAGRTVEEYNADVVAKLAMTRCIEVIGEAGHHVSPEVKAALPMIPWHMMYGMRNRIIHDYGNTDYGIVYKVVCEELPGMAGFLSSFLVKYGIRPDPLVT
jgi:uncharacterized protein with HEPN domain